MDRAYNDPLHGITPELTFNSLLICYGWEGLEERVKINCFSSKPGIKSCLKLLAKHHGQGLKLKPFILLP